MLNHYYCYYYYYYYYFILLIVKIPVVDTEVKTHLAGVMLVQFGRNWKRCPEYNQTVTLDLLKEEVRSFIYVSWNACQSEAQPGDVVIIIIIIYLFIIIIIISVVLYYLQFPQSCIEFLAFSAVFVVLGHNNKARWK